MFGRSAALAVARVNVRSYRLGHRIRLLRSDLFSALRGKRYDLIVSNPGAPIRLRDIGTIEDGFKETRSMARLDGREAVMTLVRIKECLEDPERLLLGV